MRKMMVVWAVLWCTVAGGQAGQLPEKAPGAFFPLSARDHRGAASYKRGEPVVGTTYFYWYDIDSNAHILNGNGSDAMTTHPADMNDLSYKRASWHKSQLLDVMDAGIDFIPVTTKAGASWACLPWSRRTASWRRRA
jgi:hypothetical protein